MGALEMVVLAIGLAADAMAVSVCKGLSARGELVQTALACGSWFGIFQAAMPFAGWMLGSSLSSCIEAFAPWVAFVILTLLGVKMIAESLRGSAKEKSLRAQGITVVPSEAEGGAGIKAMSPLALATSIDALAAGIPLAAVGMSLKGALLSVALIGTVTFLLSVVGVFAGAMIGAGLKKKAELVGGVVLISVGVKIILEYIVVK